MRRNNRISFFLILSLFVSILSCEQDRLPKLITEVIVNFNAETEGENGLEFSGPDEPVVIMEGESVVFKNTSLFRAISDDGSINNEEDLSNESSWIFDGGSPSTSSDKFVTVVYNTPGKYKVSLTVRYLRDENLTIPEYVTVLAQEPEPEASCNIETATSSDDRETKHFYDNSGFLILAEKFLNGVLQEYSVYNYDDSDRLEQEHFFDAAHLLLGTITYTYNANNQIISETTVDANGTLVRDRVFTWDDQEPFIIDAVYREPDGIGGLATFDAEMIYDADKHNITSEVFTQNGAAAGRNDYGFDTHPKVFTGLNIESSPLKFNRDNVTSITSLDANGTVVAQQTSTFEYGDAEESCGQPISEIRTTNGTEVTFTWDYMER